MIFTADGDMAVYVGMWYFIRLFIEFINTVLSCIFYGGFEVNIFLFIFFWVFINITKLILYKLYLIICKVRILGFLLLRGRVNEEDGMNLF